MTINVQEPAQINLSNFKKIAVGDMTGWHAADVAGELTDRLVQSSRFEVLDRAHLDQMMQEYHLTMSGLVNQDSATQLGNLIGASALIFGRVEEYHYAENTSHHTENVYDIVKWVPKKVGTKEVYTRNGKGTVEVSFTITDLTTGRILISPSITQSASTQTSVDNQPPAPEINQEDLLATARRQVISRFMDMITPHSVSAQVVLLNDSDIPELDRGIDYAKNGSMNYAIENFISAVKNHQGNKNIDKAYFDLGVAYEYANNFKDGLEMLNKAYSIKPDPRYANEISHCKSMEANYTKLQEQLQNH